MEERDACEEANRTNMPIADPVAAQPHNEDSKPKDKVMVPKTVMIKEEPSLGQKAVGLFSRIISKVLILH